MAGEVRGGGTGDGRRGRGAAAAAAAAAEAEAEAKAAAWAGSVLMQALDASWRRLQRQVLRSGGAAVDAGASARCAALLREARRGPSREAPAFVGEMVREVRRRRRGWWWGAAASRELLRTLAAKRVPGLSREEVVGAAGDVVAAAGRRPDWRLGRAALAVYGSEGAVREALELVGRSEGQGRGELLAAAAGGLFGGRRREDRATARRLLALAEGAAFSGEESEAAFYGAVLRHGALPVARAAQERLERLGRSGGAPLGGGCCPLACVGRALAEDGRPEEAARRLPAAFSSADGAEVLSGCRSGGDAERALAVLLDARRLPSAGAAWAAPVLRAYLREGGAWEGGLAFHASLGPDAAGDARVFHLALRLCGQAGDVDRAAQLVRDAWRLGLCPNVATANHVLQAAARAGDAAFAERVFAALAPPGGTVGAFLRSVGVEAEAEEEQRRRRRQRPLRPNAVSVDNLALSRAAAGDVDGAVQAIEELGGSELGVRRLAAEVGESRSLAHSLLDTARLRKEDERRSSLLRREARAAREAGFGFGEAARRPTGLLARLAAATAQLYGAAPPRAPPADAVDLRSDGDGRHLIDLHGCTAAEAAARVRRALEALAPAPRADLVIVTGRGDAAPGRPAPLQRAVLELLHEADLVCLRERRAAGGALVVPESELRRFWERCDEVEQRIKGRAAMGLHAAIVSSALAAAFVLDKLKAFM